MTQTQAENDKGRMNDAAYSFSLRLSELIFNMADEAESKCPPGTLPRDYVRYSLLSHIRDAEVLKEAVSDLPADRRRRMLLIARYFEEKETAAMTETDSNDDNVGEIAETVGRNSRLIELLEIMEAEQ